MPSLVDPGRVAVVSSEVAFETMVRKPADADVRSAVSRRGFIRRVALLGGGVIGVAAPGLAAEHGESGAPPTARGMALDVRQFGARGDGESDDTAAIQRAIDAAAGGTVLLPPGTWRSGTLRLRSGVRLEIPAGSVLLASPDDDDFAPRERLSFATSSDTETTDFGRALLAGCDLERVAITGEGVIDMRRRARAGPKPIALKRCRFVSVRGITILHSPNYCVSLAGCDDVVLDGVTIRDAYADGIDPDCCRRVRIANCDIESRDDALCLKASFALGHVRSTEDVLVTNCRMRSASNCFKLGSESTGDFRRIVVSNCVFDGPVPADAAARVAAEGGGLALETVDGGTVDGVMISNIVMTGVAVPLFVRLGNRGRDQRERRPGRLRNVSVNGLLATGATGTGSISGLRDSPVEGITLDNVRIIAAGGASARTLDVPEREDDYPTVSMFGTLPAFGLYVRHARDVTLGNVQLLVDHPDARSALIVDDAVGLRVAGVTGSAALDRGPLVWLHDVHGGLVHASFQVESGGVVVRVTGGKTANVALVGAGLAEFGSEIGPDAVTRVVPAAQPG